MQSVVLELTERWNRAWFEKDAATVDHLMAADYVYIAPNGLTLDRQAILRIICSPSYRLESGAHTEIVVRPLGRDAAVVQKHWHGTGSYEGVTFTDDHRCLMVWEQQGGEWRLVLEQCSFNKP